jgi:hypothetical protein
MEMESSSKTAPLADDDHHGLVVPVVLPAPRIMTLADAEAELRALGFTTCVEDSNGALVGVRSKFDCDLMARLDVLVFVHEVEEVLDQKRIAWDLAHLPALIDKYFTYGCPPFGLHRGITGLVVYYAKSSITRDAKIRLNASTVEARFCQVPVVAQDSSTGASYTSTSQATPCCGSAFYPNLRYLASQLTGQPLGEAQRPSRIGWRIFRAGFWLYLFYEYLRITTSFICPNSTRYVHDAGNSHSITICYDTLRLVLTLVALLAAQNLLFFLYFGILQWWRRRRSRLRVLNNNNNDVVEPSTV